jgi:hypothetical protein
MDEVKMTFETLQKKLSDKTWTDAQEPDFIDALKRIENTFQQMGSQIYIFISYFEQYVTAIQNSPIFSSSDIQSDDSQSSSPTQTSPAPANSAEKRARKTPLEVVNDKK